MDCLRTGAVWVGVVLMAGTVLSYAEDLVEPVKEPPLLTLDTRSLRSALKLGGGGTDIRLKVQRPAFGSLSVLESEWFIQGIEFRLPVDGMWVGVEKDLGEDVRRATLSLRRRF